MSAQRRVRSRTGTVGVMAAATTLLLVGCGIKTRSGADDKAGGSADPLVLTLASTTHSIPQQVFHPALQYFVDRVKELSHGAVRIDITQGWGAFSPDAEQQVVRDVTAGKIELGWVGTHVFDTVGVTAFQALTAPMLIDNNPLQRAVLDSDMPTKMLAELDEIGLTGIALLADGLRKPIAVTHPLLRPEDYQDITFQAFRSQDHAEAIKALGATAIDVFGKYLTEGLRAGEIDGFEKGLNIFKLNGDAYLAPYVAANVNLWPHTLALIANPRTMSGLTADQRGWLLAAGADASSRSTNLTDNDAESVVELCAAGARFANASESDLAAMRQAFAPVYATLERDPITKDFIDRIDEMKKSTDPGPALVIPSGCTGQAAVTPAPTTVTTETNGATGPDSTAAQISKPLDGTYRWTITSEDALANGTPGDRNSANLATFPWIFTFTMNDGTMELKHRDSEGDWVDGRGTYSVDGDRITLNWQGALAPQAFDLSVDDDGTLHLRPVLPMDPGDQFVMTTNPWAKIG